MTCPLGERLTVESAPESVAVHLGRHRAPMPAVVRQPGLESLDGIAQQHQQPSPWGCVGQERRNPAQMHVVRRPLSGDHPRRAWEPPVVLRALLGAERACREAIEEVPLLVDVVALGHAGVGGDQSEPPGGAGLLGADAHEVGRACDLTWTRLRRREVEAVLPRREPPTSVQDCSPHRRRESQERRARDILQSHTQVFRLRPGFVTSAPTDILTAFLDIGERDATSWRHFDET